MPIAMEFSPDFVIGAFSVVERPFAYSEGRQQSRLAMTLPKATRWASVECHHSATPT